jgi:protein gp37
MGKITGIPWCDHTFNPWWGCTNVSAGCDFCYAESSSRWWGFKLWGKNSDRRLFGDKHWREPLKWNEEARKAGVPAKVFCGSMCDILEDRRDLLAPRRRLWALVEQTDWLIWELLSKRPQNYRKMLPADWLKKPRANVWVMATVESSGCLWRVNELLKVPAAVRGISYEPALEFVDFPLRPHSILAPHLHWIIVAGESGQGARPFDLEWARKTVERCRASRTACFVKQLGSNPVMNGLPFPLKEYKGGNPDEWPRELQVREFPMKRRDTR